MQHGWNTVGVVALVVALSGCPREGPVPASDRTKRARSASGAGGKNSYRLPTAVRGKVLLVGSGGVWAALWMEYKELNLGGKFPPLFERYRLHLAVLNDDLKLLKKAVVVKGSHFDEFGYNLFQTKTGFGVIYTQEEKLGEFTAHFVFCDAATLRCDKARSTVVSRGALDPTLGHTKGKGFIPTHGASSYHDAVPHLFALPTGDGVLFAENRANHLRLHRFTKEGKTVACLDVAPTRPTSAPTAVHGHAGRALLLVWGELDAHKRGRIRYLVSRDYARIDRMGVLEDDLALDYNLELAVLKRGAGYEVYKQLGTQIERRLIGAKGRPQGAFQKLVTDTRDIFRFSATRMPDDSLVVGYKTDLGVVKYFAAKRGRTTTTKGAGAFSIACKGRACVHVANGAITGFVP